MTTTIIDNDAPEIDVQGKGISIVDGDTTPSTTDDTDFGSILFNAVGVTHTFTVKNTGTATLTLGAPQLPPGFELGTNQLVGSLAPGTSDTFQVILVSSAIPGIRSGDIVIPNNDADEDPYNFAVKGVIKGYEISGTIKYDTAAPKAVRGALVKAYNNDLFNDTYLGESFTDDNGHYKITTTTDATNIYVRVYAQTAPAGVGEGHVKRAIGVEDSISGTDYYHDIYAPPGWPLNASNPIVNVVDDVFSFKTDTVVANQAFWVYDAGVTASRFHASLPGVAIGSLEIEFPNPFSHTSAGILGNIWLGADDWQEWDVIIHEYGHLVAQEEGFFRLPTTALTHYLDYNMRIENPDAEGSDLLSLAFNEGWANFFSVAAQEIEGVSNPKVDNFIHRDPSGIIYPYNAKDLKYYSYDIENTTGRGEDNELSVMAILWDLYDGPGDSGKDQISMGIDTLFTFLKTHDPYSLSDLWNSLIDTASDLSTKFKYAEIFELNHISPVMVGTQAVGSSGASSKSLIIMKNDPAPVFFWDVPLGHDFSTQLLHRFGIAIYDESDTLVYDSGLLSVGTTDGTLQYVGDRLRFVPSLTDWRTNVTNTVSGTPKTFRWVAYGGGRFTDTGDISDTTFITGLYWSSFAEITVLP
ncbi:MAG: choice-of-anchor D domain-containing protein [Planctomycetaceae bacterium]